MHGVYDTDSPVRVDPGNILTMSDCLTVGSSAVIEGTFRDATDDLTTPTTYTVDYRDPSGNVTTIGQGSITAVSTGVLRASIPTDEVGVWRYIWEVVIDGAALVVPGVFCVKEDGII